MTKQSYNLIGEKDCFALQNWRARNDKVGIAMIKGHYPFVDIFRNLQKIIIKVKLGRANYYL